MSETNSRENKLDKIVHWGKEIVRLDLPYNHEGLHRKNDLTNSSRVGR